ncbi:glycerophosphoryl diester phosphodiesterase [Fodinibius salinus]|uniref:Glycerophosphoryl diester phosphodiesterase n=1 Tax=Fodinibius salinus TaxID=860790 RepID=A0A5D3YIM3_9BACT|nr:glycerophosphodiester phosphodiesterase family protein [Fodinibius salinus]TYP92585.1 glycerophosphoryl diester phosphodiesterase [Fodinibius salinus]
MNNDHQLPALYNQTSEEVIIIAHRGASAYYPENTMPAFKAAVEMGAEMIELDVMMSKDGVPIVFHDSTLYSHTNGEGLVKDYTLEELKKLDAGSWFSDEFAGTRIPTLDEVLGFAAGKIAVNIEIKSEAVSDKVEGGVVEKSLELVSKHNMKEHVLFSSFDYLALEQLHRLKADVMVAMLFDDRQLARKLPHKLIKPLHATAFNCHFRELSRRWLKDLQEYNIPHFIYTVNNARKMKRLINSGVTGIFTNRPDVLVEVAQ